MIVSKEEAAFLWKASWLSFVSGVFAIWHHENTRSLAIIPIGVWLTSMNYWRHPIYDWRRILDMAYVHVGLCYQSYVAYFYRENTVWYFLFVSLAMGCYLLSIWVAKYNSWKGTYIHGCVHVLGNIANVLLYLSITKRERTCYQSSSFISGCVKKDKFFFQTDTPQSQLTKD